jgi:preprotein translocase SecE subunit
MGPNKEVHLMFLAGGVLMYLLLSWTGDWIWGYFTRHPSELILSAGAAVVALTAGIVMYRNQRVYTLDTEVAAELRKVTWPTRKETQAATMVVVVTVIIAAILLGLFDYVWAFLTDQIYG